MDDFQWGTVPYKLLYFISIDLYFLSIIYLSIYLGWCSDDQQRGQCLGAIYISYLFSIYRSI